jgi:hypothetical protein
MKLLNTLFWGAAALAEGTTEVQTNAAAPNGAAGAIASISQNGLTFACNDLLEPLLESALNDLEIDDVDTEKDGIKIHIGNMRLSKFKCDDCVHAALVTGKGIELSINDFDLHLHSRYVLKKIISTGGECESDLKHGDISGLIEIGVSSEGHPVLSLENAAASVQDINLGCKGVSGSLLDALSAVFKKKILDSVGDAVKGLLAPQVKTISDDLAKVNLDIPITNNFAEVRFDLATTPTIDANYISVQTLGSVVPVANPGQVAPYAVPTIPAFDDSEPSFVQLILSDYTFDSAAYTYWKAGRLQNIITQSEIPASFPFQLNTSSLSILAPGLAAKYPTAVPIQIFATADPLTKPSVQVVANEGLSISLPSLMSFQPIPTPGHPVDGFTLSCPLNGVATLYFPGDVIAANLTSANCTLTEYNSTVGAVNVQLSETLVNLAIDNVLLPAINKFANAGFPIPESSTFKLTNSRLKLYDHYAVVASDLKTSKR